MNFKCLMTGLNVAKTLEELNANPDLWGKYQLRKDTYAHGGMTDIWARYNHIDHLGPHFNDEHESVWYPEAERLPALKQMCLDVMRMVSGTRLGGVLLTRLPPQGKINPHVDSGWHASYYEKFYLALQNDPGCEFCWDNGKIIANPGDLYWFRNDRTHWVNNFSDRDRISLIICIRRT